MRWPTCPAYARFEDEASLLEVIMFIRCDTRPTDVDLAAISYDDLVELSWDCIQQYRLDGSEMPEAESVAYDKLMAAKHAELR